MIESSVRETAQIIPFPARNRASKSSLRDGATRGVDRLPAYVATCEFGSGWYHDAAMEEEARKRSPR